MIATCKLKANCRLFSRLLMVWLDGSFQLFHFLAWRLWNEERTEKQKKGLMIYMNKVSQLMNNDESRGRLPLSRRVSAWPIISCCNKHTQRCCPCGSKSPIHLRMDS
jgi:hypothetical protein